MVEAFLIWHGRFGFPLVSSRKETTRAYHARAKSSSQFLHYGAKSNSGPHWMSEGMIWSRNWSWAFSTDDWARGQLLKNWSRGTFSNVSNCKLVRGVGRWRTRVSGQRAPSAPPLSLLETSRFSLPFYYCPPSKQISCEAIFTTLVANSFQHFQFGT